MKYALFEFVNENVYEIGETRWITGEDPESFVNTGWDTSKDVMVAWPTDFVKNNLSKKIVKGSIDPSKVHTTKCVARVIKFAGECPTFPQIFNINIRSILNFVWI